MIITADSLDATQIAILAPGGKVNAAIFVRSAWTSGVNQEGDRRQEHSRKKGWVGVCYVKEL
jgi:hypothetical protein